MKTNKDVLEEISDKLDLLIKFSIKEITKEEFTRELELLKQIAYEKRMGDDL